MRKNSVFLCRIFGALLVLTCCTGFRCAFAANQLPIQEIDNIILDSGDEDPDPINPNTNTSNSDKAKIAQYFSSGSTSSSVKTICPQGYYLARCGAAVSLGTNWLKGMSIRSSGIPVTTADYYSYNTSASDMIHITNLRKFFAATEPFTYNAKETTQGGTVKTAQPNVYKKDKDLMLSYICTDDTGVLIGAECEKCPGEASVAASTVNQDTSTDTPKLVWTSWNVHTIADCYMTEFSDDTGTYIYLPENIETEDPAPCYYSTNVAGTSLREE